MARRAITVQELLNRKYREAEFEGEWLDHVGRPELTGVWFIWGNSGNGKTRYALQLAEYLSQFVHRIGYNALEERGRKSIRDAIVDSGLAGNKRFQVYEGETLEELDERLSKKKSADVVFIDSIQYFKCNNKRVSSLAFKELTTKHSNKLFVVISHAKGKIPKGNTADDIYYDADLKVWIEGFKATPKSRFGGKKPYIIWEEGALEVWGTLDNAG